jgi:undecaprenyl-phosphate galactose phosphotransferase
MRIPEKAMCKPKSEKPPRAGAPLRTKMALAVGDIAALLLAFFLGRVGNWWVRGLSVREAFFGWWDQVGEVRLLLFLGLIAVVVVSFWGLGLYSRRKSFWDELFQIFRVLLLVAMMDAALVFLGKWYFSRLWLLTTWFMALVLLPAIRFQIKRALIRSGAWLQPTVILGVGENAREAAAALRSEPMMGFEVVAFLVPPGVPHPGFGHVELADRCVPLVPLGDDPRAVICGLGHPHLVVALEQDASREQEKLVEQLSLYHADLTVIPPVRGLPLLGMEATHFFSHEVLMLQVRNNLARLGPQLLKRAFDILAASVLILLLSPLFVWIAWRIWREDGAPVIFCQERVGQGGKPFRFYKFRSMVKNADELLARWETEHPGLYADYVSHNFKLKDDPRVLRVGAWLRRTSLDELPQLWNVLKGEMSLVGPRPMLEREMEAYGDSFPFYVEARPGITGLWQISGRSETTFADRANLDAWYVKNWSLWYDIAILVKTIRVVLAQRGAY